MRTSQLFRARQGEVMKRRQMTLCLDFRQVTGDESEEAQPITPADSALEAELEGDFDQVYALKNTAPGMNEVVMVSSRAGWTAVRCNEEIQ
ncbi:hypothetical protein HUB94_03180 [Paenibacillus cellulosilyticus]|nr:hypothetical protein [Paenibacillus cellulosilyticus]QKS43548.1 hypothetical protein HUB94_03180 [Paenibacillus cellulosilyticus]